MSIEFKNITARNFLSIGNATQGISLDRQDLTLILGENQDLGANGSRNGVGKCLGINTVVKVRDCRSGEIYNITVGELYARANANRQSKNSSEV